MKHNKNKSDKTVAQILGDTNNLTRILQEGINEALWQHKLAGNPIYGGKDGKVIKIAPEDIPVRPKKKRDER